MKQKLARLIVRQRIPILLLMLLLAALCATTIGKTRINYDFARYLDKETMTRRALTVMEEEFGSSEQLRIMFRDLDDGTLADILRRLGEREEILHAAHDPETDVVRRNQTTCQLVTLTLRECDAARLVEDLRKMFPEAGDYAVGGNAASQMDLQEKIGSEIPKVMVIAVLVVVLVLFLTSHAWLEPLVIQLVLAISIVINMGTNFVFPSVSFITFAVCAILQLALSIDYAIMLLHTWNDACDAGLETEEAMEKALEECFMRITSSALTTVAGLLSLLFMSFTIGFDIGIVLSKGILISMVCVFLLMPSMILILRKPLLKTRHRPVNPGGLQLARAVFAGRKFLAAALILAVFAGLYLQAGNSYSFSDNGRMVADSETVQINQVFGSSDPLALLVPSGEEDADYDRQRELVSRLKELRLDDGRPVVTDVSAMVTTAARALEYYTADDVAELTGLPAFTIRLFFAANGLGDSVRADRLLAVAGSFAEDNEEIAAMQEQLSTARSAFIGRHYARLLLEPYIQSWDPSCSEAVETIVREAGKFYGKDFYLTGIVMSTYDIRNAFESDLMRVNGITFLAILLIVAVSFRSWLLPLLLVFVIEGSIWINMGISRLQGQPIFFMSYLICVAIQMGATIDYGILVTDQYRLQRRTGLAPKEALSEAMKKSLPTVLTSGIILVTAGFIIGKQCSIYYIYSIGLLLARGTAISLLLVLTLLPSLLLLTDRLLDGKKPQESPMSLS